MGLTPISSLLKDQLEKLSLNISSEFLNKFSFFRECENKRPQEPQEKLHVNSIPV